METLIARFIIFLPFAIKAFFLFSFFWVLYFIIFIKNDFLKKAPLTFSNFNDIQLFEFPINKSDNVSYAIYYKQNKLLEFADIVDYCDFCTSLQSGLVDICDKNDYIDLDSFDRLAKKIGLSFTNFTIQGAINVQIEFPGYANKSAKIYREIYCKFSEQSAKFFFHYVLNSNLSFGLLLLYLSTTVRDDVRFIRDNREYGLQYLDIFSNSFIRNKIDLLNIWYGLITIDSEKHFGVEGGNINRFNLLISSHY